LAKGKGENFPNQKEP